LLQVLEQQEFVRVGGIANIRVDVRIICATNRNLEQAISAREFRDDLFYRLNEITLFLPPLREHKEDIPLLVNHFLDKYIALYNKSYPTLSSETIDRLVAFHWPGNIRQLENMIKQVVVRADEQIISELIAATANMGHPEPAGLGSGSSLPGLDEPEDDDAGYSLKSRVGKMIAYEEKRLIAEVLTKTTWNRRKAAELLEISYRSLLYKIKDYNLNTTK
jgi:transcriptional regulator with PAS, ATPase and Fis domain